MSMCISRKALVDAGLQPLFPETLGAGCYQLSVRHKPRFAISPTICTICAATADTALAGPLDLAIAIDTVC